MTPKEQAEVVLLVHGDSTANRPMGTIDAGTHFDAIPVDTQPICAGAHSAGREIRKLIDLVNRQPRPNFAERQRLHQAVRPGDNVT